MRVIYNQGSQRISIVPIGQDGAPVVVDSGTDVLVRIVDLREHDESTEHEVLASTVVSQDTLSISLTGAAGFSQADPHRVPANASTAVVGRTYLLQAADGRRETVQLSAINGTTSAVSLWPLRGNYATSDTLRGVELVASFPSLEANDEDSVEDRGGPYLVTWTYVVGGQTIVYPTELWVDRYSIAPPISDSDVLLAQPDLADRVRGRAQISSAIAAAWRDWLAEVQMHGFDPSLFPPGHAVKVAVRNLALSYLTRWVSGGDADETRAAALEDRARNMFGSILIGRTPSGQVQLTRDDVDHVAQPKGHLFRLT